jgi:hypothetical protein
MTIMWNYCASSDVYRDNPKIMSLSCGCGGGPNFSPIYSFVALSSKNLSANLRTDGQTDLVPLLVLELLI